MRRSNLCLASAGARSFQAVFVALAVSGTVASPAPAAPLIFKTHYEEIRTAYYAVNDQLEYLAGPVRYPNIMAEPLSRAYLNVGCTVSGTLIDP